MLAIAWAMFSLTYSQTAFCLWDYPKTSIRITGIMLSLSYMAISIIYFLILFSFSALEVF